MKKFIRRYTNSIAFSISVLILTIILLFEIIETTQFLGLIGAFVTLYIGVTQYQLNNDKMFKELFSDFNKRYDNFNDELEKIKECNANNKNPNINKIKVIDNINLWSEEYLWYKKGRIPDDVWNSWRDGMKQNFNIKGVKGIFEEERKFKESYYGLYDELL